MTNLQDCLQEVIAKGAGYVITISAHTSGHEPGDWEPTALLDDMRLKSPLLLTDHAWTEWTLLADGSNSCAIVYGIFGATSGQRTVPGYGALRAFESWRKKKVEPEYLPLTRGFVLGS